MSGALVEAAMLECCSMSGALLEAAMFSDEQRRRMLKGAFAPHAETTCRSRPPPPPHAETRPSAEHKCSHKAVRNAVTKQ